MSAWFLVLVLLLSSCMFLTRPKRTVSLSTTAVLAAWRSITLEDEGHTVTTKTRRMEAEQAIAAGEFDLRVVGHTIFFFQAEDGIRDYKVTGVQTCALPICRTRSRSTRRGRSRARPARPWRRRCRSAAACR